MDIPGDQLEVYTQFGIAAELAQVLEVDAGNVALSYLALFVNTDEITPEQTEWFRSIVEDLNRKTLGQLLRSVKQFATYDDTILETVDEALVKRNYLMHRFFPFHNFALFRVEGRKGMIAELDEIQRKRYVLAPGDWIAVKTPGGGGYGPAAERDPAMVERDIARGYYTDVETVRLFTGTRAAAAE